MSDKIKLIIDKVCSAFFILVPPLVELFLYDNIISKLNFLQEAFLMKYCYAI